MFVLGIDPGLTRCGFSLVEGTVEGPERFRVVRAGTLETDPDAPVEVRLGVLLGDVEALFSECRPDAVSVERVFFQRNVRTAVPTMQASGIVISQASKRGWPVVQYTAQEVKLAVVGYGAASKIQVRDMVVRRTGLAVAPETFDAADAIGLAMTHLLHARSETRYSSGVPS